MWNSSVAPPQPNTTGTVSSVTIEPASQQEVSDTVAVMGGDGTLNEAANGLAGSQTALAVLPGGDDLAKVVENLAPASA